MRTYDGQLCSLYVCQEESGTPSLSALHHSPIVGAHVSIILYDCYAPSPISNDESLFRLGIHHAPHVVPPSRDTCDRKFRRIMIHAHAPPALIVGHVVDPIGNRLAQVFINEIIHPHRLGLPCWLPFPPTVLKIAHSFFLLGIDREARLLTCLKCLDLLVDVFELRMAVRMLRTFKHLAVGL